MAGGGMYEALGGEAGVAAIVERFYDLMDLEPQYRDLRDVHAETLDYARDRLFKFLSGWLGGPDLYQQQYGHPRLRQRHFPFAVTLRLRNEWIACFAQALQELAVAEKLAEPLLLNLFVLGDWMRNQNEPQYAPPQPPMAADARARLPELVEVLHAYGIRNYFQTA